VTVPSPSSSTKSERTEVLYGTENTTNTILNFLYNSKTKMDICADSTWPSVAMGIDVFRNALIDINKRGIGSRYITTITKGNLSYCKEALKIGELRHLDGIKGNFTVSEKEYIASATMQEASLLQQVIYSNVKEVLEQQQYVFDSFWNKSVSAEQKIKEIEEGVVIGRTEVIQSPNDIQQLFINMVKSAKHELLLLLPSINAFYREERIGIIELLKQVAEREQRVNVRILTPTNDDIEEKLHNIVSETEQREIEIEERAKGRQEEQQQMKNKKKSFDIRRIDIEPLYENEEQEKEIQAAAVAVVEKSPVTTVTIVAVDRKESLVIEKTDDSKQNFIDAVGISTYSNSKPTVLSYISIFENLWKQTELYQDLKESTKQLELAYAQLKISDKMQGEFISAAAHELRTPIQPIISSVGIIRSRMGNLEVQGIEDSLNMITRNAERLSQLSSDILDVTKIESNSLDLEKEQLNLNEILLNTIEKHRKQITKANIDINLLFEPYEKIILVEADRGRIIQVISNLLNNAIKFTRREGGVVTVKVQEKYDDYGEIKNDNTSKTVAMVSVKDTGSGIDSDIMSRLFEKFASKSFQGTGLGLFISRSIVKAHGGKIWGENNSDGKGATFYFTLPIVSNQIKHQEQQKQQQRSNNQYE
jgi:two-component system, OmpR family, sensor histidine kinase VicK